MDIPEINVDELPQQLRSGAPLFDVREDHEFADVRIDGAIHVPLGTVEEDLGRFPLDRPVYVICAAGGRSAMAAELLRTRGVDAINVVGGMTAWVEFGNPRVTGDGG
jgi:rhodanese-related sulfurtransferase